MTCLEVLALSAIPSIGLGVPIAPSPTGIQDADGTHGLPHTLADTLAAQDPLRVELGRRLFFDPILSSDESVSCSSCHQPELGFADELARSKGVHGRTTLRNTPTLLNRVFGQRFMWDGRAETLEQQVLLPIENELEMDLSLELAIDRLKGEGPYPGLFQEAFESTPSVDSLARALADYVRTLTRGSSPYDYFLSGTIEALSPSARSGLWFFESRGGCWRCHPPPLFTDEDFHSTGIGVRDGVAEPGRMEVTGQAVDRGRFKTPTLRALAETAPYMHDGSLASLEEVVEFYRRGGNPHPELDPELKAIEMTDVEAANLLAFLRALSETFDPQEPR